MFLDLEASNALSNWTILAFSRLLTSVSKAMRPVSSVLLMLLYVTWELSGSMPNGMLLSFDSSTRASGDALTTDLRLFSLCLILLSECWD